MPRFGTSGLRFTGASTVIRNINRELREMRLRSTKGMIAATELVRQDMDRTPPRIPVDTGNLRDSWYTDTRLGYDPVVVMGFDAEYALYVHETPKKYKRSGSGAKFFESSLNRNMEKMIVIIAKEATVR